ncbi:type II secretion system F family protein [Candidatus Micrarchaeota archaeon]|nr:type II secretion system F family protein [Candidatus Micrarchaeota archaeon]
MADDSSGKLDKIKQAIERRDLEDAPSRSDSPLDERVSEIVKRLKEKDDRKTGMQGPEQRYERIKARIQGTSTPLSVKTRNLSKISGDKPIHESAYLSIIGSFYASMKGPIDRVTNFVSDIPMSQNLKENLDSAGININPEEYLIIVSALATGSFILMLFLFGAISLAVADVSLSILSPIIAVTSSVLVIVLGLIYPSVVANERASKINRELPFALRQLATQIKAGVSFHKALSSLVTSRYGVLSEELERVLKDIERGYSTEQALVRLIGRTKSRGLKKAAVQILRALKSGGNLSNTISAIADDVSFELRMKVRDFTEKLNFISVVYIMVGVVGPVVVTILSSIAQLPLIGGNFPFEYIVVIFTSIIVMMLIILFIISRMEPG